ncbi:DUF4233 domain-containing protein [Phytoactinopolyspora limicola]|uniref:DUF4233 domain-containing protein n=1 Tax=Phytoactinopolyspora limicola TaxID=2715536 RepID=UPI00140D177A|nr:DUF4233 domain-containing protein [Phytoactinopolyspora limicola]
MNRIASSILTFEVIVVALVVPVAVNLGGVNTTFGVVSAGVVAALCILGAATVRRGRVGYVIGSAAQVGAVGMGFVIPMMFILGSIFAAMWVVLLRIGPEVERRGAERVEGPGDGGGRARSE